MNKFFILFLLLVFPSWLFCYELNGKYYSENGYYEFSEGNYNSLMINFESGAISKSIGTFKVVLDEFENARLLLKSDTGIECNLRYFEFDDFLLLYHHSEDPFFIGNRKTSRRIENLVPPRKISATSYLVEKNRTYKPDKLALWGNLNYIWAEGVNGTGIGEQLFLENAFIRKLYILPGYVSIKRPDLFKKNARPARIKITRGDEILFVDLKDEAVYQVVEFQKVNKERITVEIIDVFEGTLYEDTCISSILCLR